MPLRDVVVLLVQRTLLMLVSVPPGLRAPLVGVVLTLVVVALLGAVFASVSYAPALTLESEDAFAPLLNAVVLPVLLLSGILLPMTLAPGWLQALSDVNPLEHVVEGTRAFFVGDYGSGTAWWGAALTAAMGVARLVVRRAAFPPGARLNGRFPPVHGCIPCHPLACPGGVFVGACA